jgi:hypothetical protein
MTRDELNDILKQHRLWLAGKGGKRANLTGADLTRAGLRSATLIDATLTGANLTRANLTGADLTGANLWGCVGNMREVKSLQIDTWPVTYTADTLQIGCQRHPISKWRRWNTDAGRKWIEKMDPDALEWADRHLALVLQIIDASPATPTGHEATE